MRSQRTGDPCIIKFRNKHGKHNSAHELIGFIGIGEMNLFNTRHLQNNNENIGRRRIEKRSLGRWRRSTTANWFKLVSADGSQAGGGGGFDVDERPGRTDERRGLDEGLCERRNSSLGECESVRRRSFRERELAVGGPAIVHVTGAPWRLLVEDGCGETPLFD